jgi:hypothetical protein
MLISESKTTAMTGRKNIVGKQNQESRKTEIRKIERRLII